MKRQGVLAVYGHKGGGKTTLTRALLRAEPRSVVVDTQQEYGGVVVTDPQALAEYLEAARLERRPYRVAYRDRGHSTIPPEQVFKMLQALRDCWLGIEEASKWLAPNRSREEVEWFFQYGRHNRISIVAVARRPHETSPIVRSQADVMISFRQQDPRDLEWIRAAGGDEAAERIAALSEYEWDYILCEHDEIREKLEALTEEVKPNADMDSGTVEPGAPGSLGAPGVDLAPEPEGPEGARARPESPRSPGLAPRPGEDAPGGEGGGDSEAPGGGDLPRGRPEARRRRGRKARA